MLNQLEKMTVTLAEPGGHNRRSQRFLRALLGAATAVRTLFNTCMSSVNAVNLANVRRHVAEIQTEIPQITEPLTTECIPADHRQDAKGNCGNFQHSQRSADPDSELHETAVYCLPEGRCSNSAGNSPDDKPAAGG